MFKHCSIALLQYDTDCLKTVNIQLTLSASCTPHWGGALPYTTLYKHKPRLHAFLTFFLRYRTIHRNFYAHLVFDKFLSTTLYIRVNYLVQNCALCQVERNVRYVNADLQIAVLHHPARYCIVQILGSAGINGEHTLIREISTVPKLRTRNFFISRDTLKLFL